MSIIIIDNTLNIQKGFGINDQHCKFHKIRLLCSWADIIYDKRGFSEPAFNSLPKIATGFRTYI